MKKIIQYFKRLNPYYDPYEFCGPEERVNELRQRDSEMRTHFLSLLSILIALIALLVSIFK
jgi:hypothetical protein